MLHLLHRTPFGITDPIFGRDVGYYVFVMPALEFALGLLLGCVGLALFVVSLPIHLVSNAFSVAGGRLRVMPNAQRHLGVLGALLFLLIAVRIELVRIPGLLFGDHGPLTGANYVDLHARLPALHVLTVAALAAAALLVWGAWRDRFAATAVRAIAGYIVVALAAWVIPASYQRLVVQPNEH